MKSIIKRIRSRIFLAVAFLTLSIFYISCEKEVNIDLNTGEPKLVVDGQIESGGPPVVILTKSIGYFSKIDLSTLENAFVHGAVVKVSDGNTTITLKEYSLDTGVNGFNKFFLYSIDTADFTALNFKGVTEQYYKLSIEYEGKTYEATTKIPRVRPIDSMWFRKPAGEPKVETAVLMYIKFTDPDTPGNYIRYFTRRNNDLYLPGFNSVYEDDIVNATTVDSLNLSAGYNRAKEPNFDSLGYFFRGDTVSLRWCAIDRGVFDFFRTYEYATGTVGNPFASPVNVISNIRGGALGVWAGYGASYADIIISK